MSFFFAVSGKEIQVDVGKCRSKCSHTKKLKKKEFKRLMKENPTLHPLEVSKKDVFCPTITWISITDQNYFTNQ